MNSTACGSAPRNPSPRGLSPLSFPGVQLRLDHLIIRASDPAATLNELSRRAGAPLLVQPTGAGGFLSGIVRASVDIEVLRIGAAPPPRPLGYGLGLTADVPLAAASAQLRELGFPTSAPSGATANGRSWRAVQIRGLLPDPFPVPASTKAPGALDRVTEAAAAIAMRIPLAPDTPLRLQADGPAGVRRIVLAGAGEPFALGDVAFEFAG